MRKKILRSRSGFEKPESREEAIMQNILGASNVLEPSESNIEEILKSILYNTPYTKEAEFEIEKILLAIKNNGTYDGEAESRDMKILIAILNDLDYTEEAESRIEELFIEWLHQRSSIKVLEGIPPLTFTSIGLPLINYLIEGNTIQSGTPTPDNPVMPQGTGERTGNLFDKELLVDAKGIFLDGSVVNDPNRTCTVNAIPVSGLSYVLSWVSDNVLVITATYNNGTLLNRVASLTSPTVIDTTGATDLRVAFYKTNVQITKNDVSNIILNLGSTPLPYEPYGYKIPISSAGQTTPIYLGEVETTRRIKKLVLTGQEFWGKEGSVLFYNDQIVQMPMASYTDAYCSHYRLGSSYTDVVVKEASFGVSRRPALFIHDTRFSQASDFKAYLAQQYANGTPVTVWYVIAEPETGIINEPLMKIGTYADTLSKAQAGVEIPTVSGSNTLDVNTTVKPSNIYIEYK